MIQEPRDLEQIDVADVEWSQVPGSLRFDTRFSGPILRSRETGLLSIESTTTVTAEGLLIADQLAEIIQRAAASNLRVLVDTSSYEKLAQISPPEPGAHTPIYNVALGPAFHNQLGVDLMMLLQNLCLYNTIRARRITPLLSVGLGGYDAGTKPVWHIPRLAYWFWVLHAMAPALPFWMEPESVFCAYLSAAIGIPGKFVDQFIDAVKSRLRADSGSMVTFNTQGVPQLFRRLAAIMERVWGEGNVTLAAAFASDVTLERVARDSCTHRILPVIKRIIKAIEQPG